MSAAVDSSNEVSVSARLSFSQFLRKDANRSSSHEHDLRGSTAHHCLENAAHLAFGSGNQSPLACNSQSQRASRLSGGEPSHTRIQLSPLQTVASRRRARTFPRDISAGVDGVVEPRTSTVKLGDVLNYPLTLSQLANELELHPSNGQVVDLANCLPSLLKSRTADEAEFVETKVYMSATDAAAFVGQPVLGSCGRTA